MFRSRLLNFSPIKPFIQRSYSAAAQPARKPTGIKALMQVYGYSALGVYLTIGFIDLPICFFMVHSLGETKMKLYQNRVKQVFGFGEPDETKLIAEIKRKQIERAESKEEAKGSFWEELKESTLLTEFIIAYGIHKSLIFIRLPITAAITPPIVSMLRKRGFNVGRIASTVGKTAKNKVTGPVLRSQANPTNPAFGVKNDKKKWFNLF